MPRRLLISNCAEVRPLFEGGVYKARGEIYIYARTRYARTIFLHVIAFSSALASLCHFCFKLPPFPHSFLVYSEPSRCSPTTLSSSSSIRGATPTKYYYCCGIYMRAAFITLTDDIRAVFIRGWRLFEGGVYIRKYGIYGKKSKLFFCQSTM